MARKNLLQGLMGGSDGPKSEGTPPEARVSPPSPAPRYSKGAIGAVTRSIADLKSRAVLDLDPMLIDAGGMQDRLESDSEEDAQLARSIAEYGQQVPVLVRPHPTAEGRYQIVYGRRRVLALRDLGQPVKALIRDLDDRELVMAQGQENTARRDLSFIEKCNFARQMAEAGYKRNVICDALTIDKTLISRMISVSDRIPVVLIEAVGAAPNAGRDRWLAVADALEKGGDDVDSLISTLRLTAVNDTSDARFDALFTYITRASRPPAPQTRLQPVDHPPRPLATVEGRALGVAQRNKSGVVLRLNGKHARGFDEWLVENIAELHNRWRDSTGA